jgi:hypothetical protein
MTVRQMAACAYSRSFFGSGCISAIYALIGLATTGLAADPGFEQPSPVDARRFLPQALLKSQQHRVNPEARDEKLAGAIGVSDAKRKLAAQLHVDAYTNNEACNLNWIASRGRKL